MEAGQDRPGQGTAEEPRRGEPAGGFLRLPPVKRALMSDTLRSRFLSTLEAAARAQGNQAIVEM